MEVWTVKLDTKDARAFAALAAARGVKRSVLLREWLTAAVATASNGQ